MQTHEKTSTSDRLSEANTWHEIVMQIWFLAINFITWIRCLNIVWLQASVVCTEHDKFMAECTWFEFDTRPHFNFENDRRSADCALVFFLYSFAYRSQTRNSLALERQACSYWSVVNKVECRIKPLFFHWLMFRRWINKKKRKIASHLIHSVMSSNIVVIVPLI